MIRFMASIFYLGSAAWMLDSGIRLIDGEDWTQTFHIAVTLWMAGHMLEKLK